MRRLYLSIIVTVLGSLFLLGWGLDQLAEHPDDNSRDLAVYRNLADGLSSQLANDRSNSLMTATRKLGEQFGVNLSLDEMSSFAFPDAELEKFSAPGGVLLMSSAGAHLYKTIPNHPERLLQLQIPSQLNEPSAFDFVMTASLYGGLSLVLVLWLLPLTRRLYLLTQAATKIGKGDFHVRMDITRFSYINRLEKRFNAMAEHIEKLLSDNRLLTQSLSHDIRTPMSCLRFGLDAVMDTTDEAKRDEFLQRMDTELAHMEEMTAAFLSYASMERYSRQLKFKRQPLNKLVENVVVDCQPLARQHGVALDASLAIEDSRYIYDFHWCCRALQNLLSNAIRYADSRVNVAVIVATDAMHICVEDDGKGIPDEKMKAVFDPFFKLDADRSREQGHFGLGLAIAAKVMLWHYGNISASHSKRLGGASLTMRFPN
ncbi:two-component sensor histidine kinase [Corallincola holothuriorum]|uniref:histidine kinase n=1 Tax=Corallincola holothuriorum TaxID=2282215 RepID=A0A368NFT9_9GAMM|nr:ATP-binding protein [Corallincola holothuriorum]RCU49086.1 two-component sensor histidine kinase [Corallincola holothuriorum]